MDIVEKLKGYRTAIVAGIGTVAGLLVTFGVINPEISEFVKLNVNEFYGAIIAIVSIVFGGLRTITDTKLGESE